MSELCAENLTNSAPEKKKLSFVSKKQRICEKTTKMKTSVFGINYGQALLSVAKS